MGKRLKQQVRGKGTPRYKAPSHRFKADVGYRDYDDLEKVGLLRGEVMDIIDDPGRMGVVAEIQFENGDTIRVPAVEGIYVGAEVYAGAQAKPTLGSILPLYAIPEGYYISNIEKKPGDKGKFARTAGSYAILVSKDDNYAYVKLPSKKIVPLPLDARAQIGVIAGGGFKERPLMKAGNAYYKHKARNKLWPRSRGVKMSPYDHPFGGKQHHEGKPTTVGRNAPPGQKVGHIAARQTGRRAQKSAKEVK